MRFQPREPEEAINYSRESLLREAAVMVVAVALAAVLIFLLLGQAIELAARRIPVSWEVRVFGPLSRAFDSNESEDAAVPVERLLGRISRRWKGSPYQFHVSIANSPEPNALAVPGGRVVVTRALLEQAQSENELAFVLAHELGHFRGRDHLRGMGRAAAFTLLSATVGAATRMGMPSGLAVAERLADRGFSRAQEADADRFALDLVYAEYGHLGGAFDFFRRNEAGEVGGRLAGWLSTHPSPDDRIVQLEGLAQQRGWVLEGAARAAIPINQIEK